MQVRKRKRTCPRHLPPLVLSSSISLISISKAPEEEVVLTKDTNKVRADLSKQSKHDQVSAENMDLSEQSEHDVKGCDLQIFQERIYKHSEVVQS
jgi:hypothetical protein